MNDLPDDQWRPVSIRPEDGEEIWFAYQYDVEEPRVSHTIICSHSEWPWGDHLIAWKPLVPPSFSDDDRDAVKLLEHKAELLNAYVPVNDVIQAVNELFANNWLVRALIKNAISKLDTVKMQ